MSVGNILFVACWSASAAWVGAGAGVEAVLVQYVLTGIVLRPSGGTWRAVVGWFPAFISPQILKWTRHE